MKKRYEYNMGFTLTEFMVAVAILGMLASFGIPSLTESIRNFKAKTAAENFLSTLYLARSEAVKRNGISMSAIGGSWGNGIELKDNTNNLIRSIPAVSGTTITNIGGLTTIAVDRWGKFGTNVNDASFVIAPSSGANAANTRAVCTSLGGRIKTKIGSTCP